MKPGKKLTGGSRKKLKVNYFFVNNWQCFMSWEKGWALFFAVFRTV